MFPSKFPTDIIFIGPKIPYVTYAMLGPVLRSDLQSPHPPRFLCTFKIEIRRTSKHMRSGMFLYEVRRAKVC